MTFNIDFDQGIYAQMGTPAQSLGFPEVLRFADAGHLIASTRSPETFLGVDGAMDPVTVNRDTESPHILVVASTGGGKSTVGRSILATAVAQGAVGVILDVKQCSHRWAYGSDKIGYAATVPNIGTALVELGRETHRRNAIIRDWPGEIDTAPVGPPIVVLFEEMNATMTQLRNLDKRVPDGEYKAAEAFNDVLLLGRTARVHIVGIIQFPDYRVIGQAMMEQFNARVMIRYTKNAWVKIAWDAGLPQAAPSQTGRGMLVMGGRARETQFIYLTEQECRAMVDNYGNALSVASRPAIAYSRD